ncbi:hypothetical protein K7432_004556 [Basidiobolus ranarum]|uniref:SET domain-containing protein n=1 Tax=Basidiobolus ranarum TaxID=34480 RepID=A0ABR2WY40_9FUNG
MTQALQNTQQPKSRLYLIHTAIYAFLFYYFAHQYFGINHAADTHYSGDNQLHAYEETIAKQNHLLSAIMNKEPPRAEAGVRKFYQQDFLHFHQVVPLNKMVADPNIERFLDSHDITTDSEYPEYVDDEASLIYLAQKYGPFIEKGTANDKRMYVRWVDDDRGYGLYSSINIPGGSVLGVFGGVITNESYTTDYMWSYKGNVLDDQGNKIDLGIDAKAYGNWFRFANHHDEPNARGIYVPYKNRWYVMYVAQENIPADQQIYVSYGYNYWTQRTKIL